MRELWKVTRVVLCDNHKRADHFFRSWVVDRKDCIVVDSLTSMQGLCLGPKDMVYDLGVSNPDLRTYMMAAAPKAEWVRINFVD